MMNLKPKGRFVYKMFNIKLILFCQTNVIGVYCPFCSGFGVEFYSPIPQGIHKNVVSGGPI